MISPLILLRALGRRSWPRRQLTNRVCVAPSHRITDTGQSRGWRGRLVIGTAKMTLIRAGNAPTPKPVIVRPAVLPLVCPTTAATARRPGP